MEQDKELKLKPTVRKNLDVFEWLLMVIALVLVLLFLPVSIWFCIKIVREHERAVIFRLGHLLCGRPRGPGWMKLFVLGNTESSNIVKTKMRQTGVFLNVCLQVVTKDLVRPELSAVCFYQIENLALCSAALSSLTMVLQSLVQAAIRDIFAQHTFIYTLQHRRRIGEQIRTTVDAVACHIKGLCCLYFSINCNRCVVDVFIYRSLIK
uniref:Band 7 domain-containing protein n=1 Tax=Salarias fasciatus TaxID=181472 RepID=A0A672G5U2_SALFA